MDPLVDLSPDAEDNAVAVVMADHIRKTLTDRPHRITDFRALRGTVLMVASDTGISTTLRFDHGRVTIHDGAIGIPWVTFCGPEQLLLGLPQVVFHRRLKIPVVGLLHRRGGKGWWRVVASVAREELRIYGLWAHPRFILTLLRCLSVQS